MRELKEQPAWVPDIRTFGARLALTRWQMGWNIAEAERECGFSQNTWSNWESGAQPRNYMEAVAKIVWATKVDRLWLLTGDGSPAPLPHPDSNGEPTGFQSDANVTHVDFAAHKRITHTKQSILPPSGVSA